MPESKRCSRCLVVFGISGFGKHRKGRFGVRSTCRACVKIAAREYWQRNLQENRRKGVERSRRCHEKNPHKRRENRLKNKYKLTPEKFEDMKRDQKGKCAICLCSLGTDARTSVDHDHLTGKVRGLLCGPCNTGLGSFRDSVGALGRAAEYLIKGGGT